LLEKLLRKKINKKLKKDDESDDEVKMIMVTECLNKYEILKMGRKM